MSVYDPTVDGFSKARLLTVTTRLAAVANKQSAHLAGGMWNPLFAAADASEDALLMFAEIRKIIDHYAAQAEVAEAARDRDSDGSGEADETGTGSAQRATARA